MHVYTKHILMCKSPTECNLEDQNHNTKTHLTETIYEPTIKVLDNSVLDLEHLFFKFQAMDKFRKLLIYGLNSVGLYRTQCWRLVIRGFTFNETLNSAKCDILLSKGSADIYSYNSELYEVESLS